MSQFIFGDCMDYLPDFEDNFFDLAIVDPPYGINFGKFNRTNKDSNGVRYKSDKYKGGDWDNSIPEDNYFEHLIRVSKNQIVFGGNYFPFLAKKETPNLKKIEEFNKYIRESSENWIFWYKQNPVPNFADGELAWISFNENKQFDYRYYGNLEGHTSSSKKYHPTQKPIQLYKWLLRNYAEQLFKILDTHVGSGSSLCAFEDFHCEYIGYEIDEDYYLAARKRLKQHTDQLRIF